MWKDYEKNLAMVEIDTLSDRKIAFNESEFGQFYAALNNTEKNVILGLNDMNLERSYAIQDPDYYETNDEKKDQYTQLVKNVSEERLKELESTYDKHINSAFNYNQGNIDMHDLYRVVGNYVEKSIVNENDYVLKEMIGEYEGQQAILKVQAIPYEQLADCTAYHTELGFFQAGLDPRKPQELANEQQIKEFESEYQLMTDRIEEQEAAARKEAASNQADKIKEPEHNMKGQNSHWDKVIDSIETEMRSERAEQQRDSHSMYGENNHWDAVIESVALSNNEVNKFPANVLPNQEPENSQELATLQNLLGDAVRRAEIILDAKHTEVSKALAELSIEELEKYKGTDLTADQLLTITNEFQNKITEAISTYAADKVNKISWTERLENFKDKVKDAVNNLKENVQSRLQSIKNIPENSKNYAKTQLLRAVVNLNQTLQNELGKVEEKLQGAEKEAPVKPVVETTELKSEETTLTGSEFNQQQPINDKDRVNQMIGEYKEEYGKHLLKNFNRTDLTPNYDLMRKLDESLKTKPDLIAKLRLDSIATLREKELSSVGQTSPDKANLENYLTDKADGISHSLKFMESTQQRVFLFKDLENTPYVVKSSKEIREELMQQLQKEQASEKELENLASGAGKTSDAKNLFKESNENKLRLIERIEEINGGEKILSDREQKYSLYAAYHNLVQENPQITPEERKTAVTNSPDEWKAADIKNGTTHYNDIYFEHDLKDQGKSPAEYSFEQVYDEFGIGKAESQQMEAANEEMELG